MKNTKIKTTGLKFQYRKR